MSRYNEYSDFLKKKYGEKVYKVPLSIPVTCPNRDGLLGTGGCIFCGSIGADYETRAVGRTITEQLSRSVSHIGAKYKAEKFIAYFGSFTNTYAAPDDFRRWMEEAAVFPSVVAIDVSTRPDCVHDVYLEILREIHEKYKVDVTVELGLQSSNIHTLQKLSRGHSVAECIDALLRIYRYGFSSCVHVIADLPWDDMEDVIETARFVSVLFVDQVKLHSLYVVKGTVLEKEVAAGNISLLPIDDYIERVLHFIAYSRKDIVFQRIVGRASGENVVSVNGGAPWWEVKRRIDEEMVRRDWHQGDFCDYIGGRAVRLKFLLKE